MYTNKKQIDAHVRSTLLKCTSETERQLRSFTIAKFYYKVNEYQSAEEYLCSYLQAKEENDQAHKLLGQVYQRLKKPDKALQSFQRSLQINPKQPDILAEVCRLLLENKPLNPNTAKYWCDLAESEKVQNDSVFSLRLKLLNTGDEPANQVEELFQGQINANPDNVHIRVRLVRYYLDQKKIEEAFKYVFDLEMAFNDVYASSSEWYGVIWLVLTKYEQMQSLKKDWDFWLLLTICLERQIYFSFVVNDDGGSSGITETAKLLFSLDQYLYKIAQMSEKFTVQRELVKLFLDHYRGQLLMHAASFVFMREQQQNRNTWKDSTRMVLPMLLLAYQIEPPDFKDSWMKHANERERNLIQMWSREGAFRCAQVGRTLLACIEDTSKDTDGNKKDNSTYQLNSGYADKNRLWKSGDDLLDQIRRSCSDKQWRRAIFSSLFCNSDQKVKEQTSMFVKCAQLSAPEYKFPISPSVERYEESAQFHRPKSLEHMVYLCVGNERLQSVRARGFNGMNFSTNNLSFCGMESLNLLDVESFLYCTVLQTKRKLEVDRDIYEMYNSDSQNACPKPRFLPFVNMHGGLCTEDQAKWWLGAYLVFKNLSIDNVPRLRADLLHGIEVIRGVRGAHMDLIIVFQLGDLLRARAQDSTVPFERNHLEARAEHIYIHALYMMRLHQKEMFELSSRYFKYERSSSASVERALMAHCDEAVKYVAKRYMARAAYEQLIDDLADIKAPFATFSQAEAYRKMDETNQTVKKSNITYLQSAIDCLNQTQSLLTNSELVAANHPLKSIVPTELKRVQTVMRFFNDNAGHNNSSTYEDAEDEYVGSPALLNNSNQMNRSRREVAAALLASTHNSEMESLVKQMANTLTLLKEEIVDNIKPEVVTMRKEIKTLSDKVNQLEEAMKKTRISSSNPPSHDDVPQNWEDYCVLEDNLMREMCQPPPQTVPMPQLGSNLYAASMGNGAGNGAGVAGPFMPMQQRLHTPNALQMQQNAAVAAAAAAYNNPMFNPNYAAMNFYTSPFMLRQQAAAASADAAMMGQRCSGIGLPFLDSNALPFNLPPTGAPLLPNTGAPLLRNGSALLPPNGSPLLANSGAPLLPAPGPEALRTGNLFPGLAPTPTQPMAPTLPMGATFPGAATSAGPVQFNKALNNQPVEKGPPANVVITSSDPLPNPKSAPLQTQQQTLSVTIPSHHIKPSLVQTPDGAVPIVGAAGGQPPTGASSAFGGFSFGGTATKSQTSSMTAASAPPATVNPAAFSFKDQVAQAAKSSATAAAETGAHNKTNESSASNDLNRSDNAADPEAEYDPRPDFKPIIPLPDEIEVRTGEEDEEVRFCYRAKLHRHSENEWKERGTGDIKILQNKAGHSRILMRRDQTHKICANHNITKEMLLVTPKDETKGFIYCANDFSDGEMKYEKFLLRFKLPATAKEFAECFRKAQKVFEEPKESKTEEKKPEKPVEKTAVAKPPFGLAKSGVANFSTSTPATKGDETMPAPPAGDKPKVAAPATASKTLFGTASSPSAAVVPPPDPKSIFGVVNTPAAPSVEPKKDTPSPFANFSFNLAPFAPGTSPFADVFSKLNEKSGVSPFADAQSPSFQTPFATPNATPNAAAAPESNLNKTNTSDAEDEYVPTAQFNPVIPLPDLVEVSTGEEDEVVLFEHRAKLLRYDKESGEWKERGLGNMKLLQQKDDLNRVRLVMRREQVHKLCCNQRLHKNTSFSYAKGTRAALVWAGPDYSENELVTETLSIRFKTAEICKNFFDTIQKAQERMTSDADEESGESAKDASPVPAKPTKEQKAVETKEKSSVKGFGDAFKPKPGAWSCEACYTANTVDRLYCLACEGPKDATVPKKDPNADILSTTTNQTFKFGFGSTAATSAPPPVTVVNDKESLKAPVAPAPASKTPLVASAPAPSKTVGFGDKFKPKSGSWECPGCYVSNPPDASYCTACQEPKDATIPRKDANSDVLQLSNPAVQFSFGFPAAPSDGTAAPPSSMGFNFGQPPVATKSDSAVTTTTTGGDVAADFSLGRSKFSFTLKPKSPGKGGNKSPPTKLGEEAPAETGEDGGEEGSEYHEEEENTAYFAPVIPLPDKIDVKTGEENEELLYVHRAKLYRYAEGEWKERGIGDVKILRHKDSQKLRVVMRRDQVLKICLNHALNEDVEYKQKDEKSWLFVVNDFSEGAVELEKLSLRFKNKDIAQDFMSVVKSALAGTAKPIEEKKPSVETPKLPEATKAEEKATGIKKNEEKPDADTKQKEQKEAAKSEKKDTEKKVPEQKDAKKKVVRKKVATKLTEQEKKDIQNLSKEERQLTTKLKLPLTFFVPPKEPCPGCIGCNPDEFVFPDRPETNELVPNDVPFPLAIPAVDPALYEKRTPNKEEEVKEGAPPKTAESFSFLGTVDEVAIPDKPEQTTLGTFVFGDPAKEKPAATTPMGEKKQPLLGNEPPKLFSGSSAAGDGNSFGNSGSIFNLGGDTAADTPKEGSATIGSIFDSSNASPFQWGKGTPNMGSIFEGKNLFSNIETSSLGKPTNMFSGLSSPASGGSIFGGNAIQTPTKSDNMASIFDGKSAGDPAVLSKDTSSAVKGGNIFGGMATGASIAANIFGGSPQLPTQPDSTDNIFGRKSIGSSSPAEKTAPPATFGVTAAETRSPANPIKSGTLFDGTSSPPASTTASDGNLFSGKSTNSLGDGPRFDSASVAFSGFGLNKTESPKTLFGNGGGSSVGAFGANNAAKGFLTTSSLFNNMKTNAEEGATKQPLLGGAPSMAAAAAPTFADLTAKDGGLDFAALAAKANSTEGSGQLKGATKAEPGSFIGLTNNDAFSSFLKPGPATSNGNGSGNGNGVLSQADAESPRVKKDDGEANEENYDPHYEPIIPLPDEIEVSTGEEQETKIFGDRAVLYRWTPETKEWKERGVGELKILKHNEMGTFRLLMRREQIHKLVLNQRIGSDFEYTYKNNNPRSFVWLSLNFAETPAGEHEQLTVRFKKVEVAQQFEEKLKASIESARKREEEQQNALELS